jgi:hypothetical protein
MAVLDVARDESLSLNRPADAFGDRLHEALKLSGARRRHRTEPSSGE